MDKSLLTKEQWGYLRRRYEMTDRELEVSQMACCGFGNEEIAAGLEIKLGTVKTHLRNIYRKVWVKNKVQLLIKFINEAGNHQNFG